jgi:RNA polymerase sigma factor (TIGR02999 family)
MEGSRPRLSSEPRRVSERNRAKPRAPTAAKIPAIPTFKPDILGNVSEANPTALTQILNGADPPDSSTLLSLVYDQLRQLAQQRMSAERPGQTLQATALVHEAWLRLGGGADVRWANRAHFFAAAAEAMRRILIERARQKAGPRRGGDRARVDLPLTDLPASREHPDLLALDQALSELERHDEQAARLVKLRYFVGMAHNEAAEALGIGRRAADRLWALARAWLYERLGDRQ